MKRIVMSAVVLMLATAAVNAQSDSTKAPRHQQHKMQQDGAMTQLNLSAEQQAQLKIMRQEFKQQREALAAQKLTEAERRTQMKTLHQQQRTKMNTLLTPAQKEQLAKQRAEHKSQMRTGKRGNHDGNMSRQRGAKMQQELNLTTQQQAKMKEIRTTFRSKAETLRNDQSLNDAQRKEKFQELRKQQQEQLKTVLTKEQQEKMQSLRKERGARNTR
jgi:Spy/CpxP family protein refolding chaperone